MPSKDYRIWLSDTAYIVLEFEDYIRNYLQS
jgi:hypothetical protein